MVIILVAQQAMMKFMITPTSRVKPNENMVPSVEAPNAVPNTSIRITATMITVRLESRIAVKPRWKPFLIAPSMVLPGLELLADTLCGKHVAVNAHADGEDNTCNTRDSEGAARVESEESGNSGEHTSDLTSKRDNSDNAGQTVVSYHEYRDNDECDNACNTHCVTRAGTQYRRDRGQVLDLKLEWERTAVDHVSELLCVLKAFVAVEAAGRSARCRRRLPRLL